MELYLIRHGRQSSRLCNVNVDLSPEGRRQAALLGHRLADWGIEVLYSSSLIRAVQTAEEINRFYACLIRSVRSLERFLLGKWRGFQMKRSQSASGNLKSVRLP